MLYEPTCEVCDSGQDGHYYLSFVKRNLHFDKNATEEIRQKSLKKDYKEKGIKENIDILDDDLTIIGIGK